MTTDVSTAPGRDVASETATVRGEGIHVTYRDRIVVDVASIELPAGRTYALLGASGAGKSTLLRVLGLLEPATAGRVLYDGRPVGRHDLKARRRIAAVFQKPYLLRGTVGHNVGYGLRMRGVAKTEVRTRVAESLERVGLSGWEDRSALTLSGGEAQRVTLARALVLRPNLLLLDEPLSYMDPLLKRELTREFAEILASEHVTALYVTHDQEEAAVVADRIGIMREGRIVAEGDPSDVLTLPTDPWVAGFLGTEVPSEGRIVRSEGGFAVVECGGLELKAASDLPGGTGVLVGVRPEDVLLARPGTDIQATPERNRVSGTVGCVAPVGVTVRVVIDTAGPRLSATVSRSAAGSLRLAPGDAITMLFDATAVRLDPADPRESVTG